MSAPKLSICIPTLNRAASLEKALASLSFVHDLGFEVEIVVCDNASTDGTASVVQAMTAQLPSLKYFRQRAEVGIVANHASAFRMASGRYAMFLADDDRLDPGPLVEIIEHLDREAEIVACFTGWYEWDDQQKESVGHWNRIKQIRTFGKSEGYQLFDFIVNRHIFPEIGVYRTAILNRIRFLSHQSWDFHLWMYRCLDHGKICFHPSVYYRNLVVFESGQVNRGRQGNRLAVEIVDKYRASAEMLLLNAAREDGVASIRPKHRKAALEMVNRFVSDRLIVAARLSHFQHDYVAAVEFFSRYLLWCRPDKAPIDEFRPLVPLAAAQAIVEVFEQTPDMRCVIVCGFANPAETVRLLRRIRDELPIRVCTLAEVSGGAVDRESLVLVETAPALEALVAGGVPSGRVLCFAEAYRSFSFDPKPAGEQSAGGPNGAAIVDARSLPAAVLEPVAAHASPRPTAAPVPGGGFAMSGICRLEEVVSR